MVSRLTGTYWGKQTNRAPITIQQTARIFITGPARPRLRYRVDGILRRLANRRQIGIAYDVVKQTADAPNKPFKAAEGAKQRTEKMAHPMHDAKTALKGVWKRSLTSDRKFRIGKPPVFAKDQITLLQPVVMLTRPLRVIMQYMRHITTTNAVDGKASQQI
jgi:hypothetical protein